MQVSRILHFQGSEKFIDIQWLKEYKEYIGFLK